jgi:hypothetical protein
LARKLEGQRNIDQRLFALPEQLFGERTEQHKLYRSIQKPSTAKVRNLPYFSPIWRSSV